MQLKRYRFINTMLTIIIAFLVAIVIYVTITEKKQQEQKSQAVETEAPIAKVLTYHSLDFDGEDAEYLLKIAHIKAQDHNTPLNKARAMLVTINKVYDQNKPIYDVCIEEARISGYTVEEFLDIEPDANDVAAYDIIMLDRFDDTGNCLDYEEVMK